MSGVTGYEFARRDSALPHPLTLVDIKDMSQRSFVFTENCLATVLSEPYVSHCQSNLNIQKWHVYYHGCQGKKLQRKENFIFSRRKIDKQEVKELKA